MFDTDLNHHLQSLQNPWLTALMLAISGIGSELFLTAAAGFILFVISIRKGTVIFQILLWSFLLTTFFKELLDLPRPTDIDPSVHVLYPAFVSKVFTLPANPGFPSGHVFSTVAFCGAVLLFFPTRINRIAGLAFLFLMPVSRMYLGKHFLVDVIGGFVLGVLILLPALLYFHRDSNHFSQRFDKLISRGKKHSFWLIFYILVLPFVLNLIPFFDPRNSGKFLGVNVGLYWAFASGHRREQQWNETGFIQFLFAALCYAGTGFLLSVAGVLNSQNIWIQFVAASLPPAISIAGAVETGKRWLKP